MSKSSKKISKNMKKNNERLQEENENNEIKTFIKIVIGIIVLIGLICLVTYVANERKNNKETENTVTNEILAGQTFSQGNKKYYVVFYDFKENKELTSTIDGKTDSKIYKVDLSNGMNKNIIASESNKKALSASELKVNGPTVIEINNNTITNYIEGLEEVNNFIKNIK